MAHAILPVAGKGGSDCGYAAILVVGPLIGGALAGGCCGSQQFRERTQIEVIQLTERVVCRRGGPSQILLL